MAHTLNEQSIVIPSGTAADCIELLMSAIETLTGWYRDGYTVSLSVRGEVDSDCVESAFHLLNESLSFS